MANKERDSLSTDSSDSEIDEDKEIIESCPDGFKFKKKLLALIKRVKRDRKLSIGLEDKDNAESKESQPTETEKISNEDKFVHVSSPVASFGFNSETNSYDISSRNPGLAVFIINSDFRHQPYRPFAKMDHYFMHKLFKYLGFEIQLLDNRRGADLWKNLIDIKRTITEQYDCFVCVISSHGAELPLSRYLDPDRKLRQHVIFTRDGEIPTDRILEVFSDDQCPNLKGKPRMFFIQACRCVMGADEEFDVDKGADINVIYTDVYDEEYPIIHINRRYKTRSDNVNEPTHDTDTSSLSDTKQRSQCSNGDILNDSSQPDTRGRPEDGRNSPRNYKEEYFRSKEPASFCLIPCYEDYLVMFSSASERTAWSDKGKGGWLMYCLYKVFKRQMDSDYKIDLLRILSDVSGKMALELKAGAPSDPSLDGTKSTATIYHMLTKNIYLKPKHVIKLQTMTETAL